MDETTLSKLLTLFQGDFGGFLQFAVAHSSCNTKAKEHFQYAASGYKFERDYKAFVIAGKLEGS